MDTCNHFNHLIIESNIDWNNIKENGKDSIPKSAESVFDELFEIGRNHGLFIVDVGELEGWIDLKTSKGSEWVIEALDEIDDDNCSKNLYEFVVEIREYLNQQYRELIMADS